MILRPATLDDLAFLLRLRNDPVTRANSWNTAPLTDEEHAAWLPKALADPDTQIFIAEVGATPVGTIRTTEGPSITEVSYTVAPEHRRKGYGLAMLNAVKGRTRGYLAAFVKVDNTASCTMALRAGFKLRHTVDGVHGYRWP